MYKEDGYRRKQITAESVLFIFCDEKKDEVSRKLSAHLVLGKYLMIFLQEDHRKLFRKVEDREDGVQTQYVRR